MNKRFLIYALLIPTILSVGCSRPTVEVPENFGFILKYGVGARNVLNTFEHQFTKDTIVDPPITIELRLSEEQRALIYKKMQEIDFFKYPEEYFPGSNMEVTPFDTFEFEVKAGTINKRIHWEDKHLSKSPGAEKMRELIGVIREIIKESPEYKKLPEPRGGYL